MVKGYIAGTRKDHHRQTREEEGERKGKTAPGRLKKGPKDSNTDDTGDNEDDEDEVPPPSSSTKARKSKKSAESNPGDVEMPRSSSSSKSGGKSSFKSRKRVRDLAAIDESDLEETPIKKPRLSRTRTLGSQKNSHGDNESDHGPSSRKTSRGEEDNGEDQGGLGSDVYAD
jgi:hypothetical protein